MKLHYQLKLEDFLEFQLYTASKSKSIIKKRKNSRLIMAILYVVLGLLFIATLDESRLGLLFTAVGVLWYLLYPVYSRQRYRTHYEKHIIEHYQNRVDKSALLEITPEYIYSKDEISDGKIDIKGINNLIELKKHFFIKLLSGPAFIVPKEVIPDENIFKALFESMEVRYMDEREWEWS